MVTGPSSARGRFGEIASAGARTNRGYPGGVGSRPHTLDMSEFWDAWGAIAETVGGLGAGGALLVAARAFYWQVDEARGRQASRVLFRVTVVGDDVLEIGVDNRSDLPIYNLFVAPLALAAHAAGRAEGTDQYFMRTLDAGKNWTVRVERASRRIGNLDDPMWADFDDAASRRWQRVQTGRLTEISRRRGPIRWVRDLPRTARRWTGNRWEKLSEHRARRARKRAEQLQATTPPPSATTADPE